MIGISTKLFDLEGFVIFPTSSLQAEDDVVMSRRVSATKTLDGGSFVSDFGYSVTDDVIAVTIPKILEADFLKLKNIIELHSAIVVTSDRGAFACVPTTLTLANGTAVLGLVVSGVA